jgi:hypothetical protein
MPGLPDRYSSAWACLLLLGSVLLIPACHAPLRVRKDAGQAGDARGKDTPADLSFDAPASPDLPADVLAPPDLVPRDLAEREAPPPDLPTGVPKAFRFVNHTDATAYVRVDDSVGCRRQDASGWQDCSFFTLGCMVDCGNAPANGDCCEECEQPLPSLYAVAPGESRTVPWNGNIYAKASAICSQCDCQVAAPAQSGNFEASASVYADYQCSPMPSYPCQATADGMVQMATPRGSYATLVVPFSLPYPGDEIVLDITSLPATDAGTEAGGGSRDTAGSDDVVKLADTPSGQDVTACQPLAYSHFSPWTGPSYCPVDPSLPECASSDRGAMVYRDEACALATLEAHSDCGPWQRPLDSEFVFLKDPFGGCNWPITIDSVLDCGDHVDINYSVTEPCQTCDGIAPSSVMLIIRDDPKPVLATAALVRERC